MASVVNTVHHLHTTLGEVLAHPSTPIREPAKSVVGAMHRTADELIEHIMLTHSMDLDAHSQHELRHVETELQAADRAFAAGQDTKGWSHLESATRPLSEIIEKYPKEGLWHRLRKRFQLHA